MARLKLRELLMPEVVSQVDMEGAGGGKAQRVNKVGVVRGWWVCRGRWLVGGLPDLTDQELCGGAQPVPQSSALTQLLALRCCIFLLT